MMAGMSTHSIEVDEELIGILRELQQPIDKAATELIVLELYRMGKISSGRGAALLHMSRKDFIQHASDLGIPYLRITAEDLESEIDTGRFL
jgi:predicted HTH domain antitoxin